MRLSLAAALLFSLSASAAQQPAFYLSAERQPLPGEEAEVLVRSRGEESGKARAFIFRAGMPRPLLAQIADWRRVLAPPGSPLFTAMAQARSGRGSELKLSLVGQQDVLLSRDFAQPAKVKFRPPEPGLYLVAVELDAQAAYALVNVTSLALVWKRSSQDALAFAADRTTGAPRPGVKVSVLAQGEKLATKVSGSDGAARFDLPYQPRLRVVAGARGEFALLDDELYAPQPPRLKGYVFTDRPVYRPGEKVFVKGIVRELRDELPRLPREPTEATLEVTDARGRKLLEGYRNTLQEGALDASLELPRDVALGRAVITLRAGGSSFTGELEVQEFQKPKFTVAVRPRRNVMVSGEPASVEVSAEYYGGGPVSAAQVRWKITRSKFDLPVWRRARPGWYQGEAELRAAEETLVAEGQDQLDAKGFLTLPVPTAAVEADWTYVVRAQVFDQSRAGAAGSGSFLAAHGEFRIAAQTDRAVVQPGEEIEVQVVARDYAGQPVQAQVQVALQELDTSVAAPGGAKGGQVRARLGDTFITTGADGRAAARFRIERGGHVRVVCTARDSRGRELSATTYFWSAGNEAITLSAGGLQIVADKETYAPGEQARLILLSPRAGGTLLLTVEGRRIERYQVRAARGNALLITLPIDEKLAALAPNVHLGLSAVTEGKVLHASHQLAVVPKARLLKVSIETDKRTYSPRQVGRVRVRTTDLDGKPVSAEVTLSAVDESLYAVTPERAPPLARFFVPRRRNAVGSADSAALASFGYAVALPGRSALLAERKRQREQAAGEEQQVGIGSLGGSGAGYARSYSQSFDSASVVGMLARPGPQALAAAMSPPHALMERQRARPQAVERKEFATTILWKPSLRTSADGLAEVDVSFPDDVTAWRFTARAASGAGQFGDALAQATTTQALIARLTAPASLTERDVVSLGATVQNNTEQPQSVRVQLEARGLRVLDEARTLEVPAGGSRGVIFQAQVLPPYSGTAAQLHLTATSASASDAMAVNVPIQPHGAPRFSHASGTIGESGARAILVLERGARPGSATLSLRALSGPQAAIDGALPYLVGYPYGCVEQTLSRFVPDLVALRVLQRSGRAGDADLRARVEEVQTMVRAGVARLRSLQNPDGSFGWFSNQGYDEAMTAHAVAAIGMARDQGADLPEDFAERVAEAGERLARSGAPLEARAQAIFGLAFLRPGAAAGLARAALPQAGAASLFAQSYLALALATQVHREEAAGLLEQIAAAARAGIHGDAAHDPVELSALALHALVVTGGDEQAIDALARGLFASRHQGHWRTTRASAAAVEALAAYLFARQRDARGQGAVLVELNGKPAGRVELRDGEARLEVTQGLREGNNELSLRREGSGFAAFDASLSSWSEAENLGAADGGLRVERRLSVLRPDGASYREEEVRPGQALRSGDVLRVRLAVHTAEARRYVIVEAPRPSGFAAISDELEFPIAGEAPRLTPSVHREDRDQLTAFFLRELPEGRTELTYLLRAEQPGDKHVLPALAQAMYAPEIAGASAEVEVKVQ